MNTNVPQAFQTNQVQLNQNGTLAISKTTFLRRNASIYGVQRTLAADKTIAARTRRSGQPKPKSNIVTIGTVPDGFGKQIVWHSADAALALVAFLNAGDYFGVMISGVRNTDTIEFVSATGIASFSEDTKNKGVGAFIGIVAAGASITAASFGAPELAPLIGAAETFAKSQFEESKVKTKRRDPFGEDPASGHDARQEGGILVSLPRARQAFYSGNKDHQERWIKKPGTRDDEHRPEHVRNAFFLRSGTNNLRRSDADGDIIIYPWDHSFADNFGFYRLHIIVRRGSGTEDLIE